MHKQKALTQDTHHQENLKENFTNKSQDVTTYERYAGRNFNQLRPVSVTYDPFGYAAASVLLELGRTKVLCSISLNNSVPHFLKGSKTGWLTAEYAMLPTATTMRTQRDSTLFKSNGRSIEISRFIGRSLRAVVNLGPLGERTIHIDCDVLQADGGTRTACITAAYLALRCAVNRWLRNKTILEDIITHDMAAVSVGIINGVVLLDIDSSEDTKADADFNIVLTRDGKLIEIQGATESQPLEWSQFDIVRQLAHHGVEELFEHVNEQRREHKKTELNSSNPEQQFSEEKKTALFSLYNRIQKNS